MAKRYLWALLLGLLVAPCVLAATDEDYCRFSRSGQTKKINGFTVELTPFENDPELFDGCRVVVRKQGGAIVFRAVDWALSIHAATGRDINRDGEPDLVIEGYSGGAHCCWTYWIVSLGKSPGIVRKLCNYRPAEFEDLDRDGKIEIVTLDGAFDYFDEMSHASSPFPGVVLKLEGRVLNRINSQFWSRSEGEIQEAKKNLTARAIAEFRTGDREALFRAGYDWEETKQHILEIVLAYLYADREAEAWQNLHEMWPPKDEARIRKEILSEARGGFLGDPRRPGFGCLE